MAAGFIFFCFKMCLDQHIFLINTNVFFFISFYRFIERYSGFNDWKKHKKSKPVLSMNNLKSHSSVLFDLLSLPFTKTWGDFKETVLNLALVLNRYATFLEKSNFEQKERQNLNHPVREVMKHAHLYIIPMTEDHIDTKYSLLEEALSRLEFFEYLHFEEELHLAEPFKDRSMRYSFFENLALSFPVNLVRYDPGGSIGVTVFIWKVPPARGVNEVMNDTLRIIDYLKPRLPEYHTRLMRREFTKRYCNLNATNIPKHELRAIYANLTNDATTDQNPTIDARVVKLFYLKILTWY